MQPSLGTHTHTHALEKRGIRGFGEHRIHSDAHITHHVDQLPGFGLAVFLSGRRAIHFHAIH